MSRMQSGDRTPRVKPVERIELTERHFGRRLIAFLICLVVAIASISYGVHSLLTVEPGWTEIDVGRSVKTNCAGEFTFRYYLGKDGKATRAEQNAVVARYTRAAVEGYQLFNSWEEVTNEEDGAETVVHNLWYVNNHPNEEIEVPRALYRAFEKLERAESRLLYLGPVYEIYQSLFFSSDDALTAGADPFQNAEVASFCQKVADFSQDPASVDLKLLGENRVCLSVSPEYQAYAEENDVGAYLDFFWMKNAFLADFLADYMLEGGFAEGFLSSYDGFCRSLSRETGYSLSLYGREDDRLLIAARLELKDVSAVVSLNSFPLADREEALFYQFQSGEVRLPYVDAKDGLSRSAADSVTAFTSNGSCADLILQLAPYFIGEAFDDAALKALWKDVPTALVLRDNTFLYHSDEVALTNLYRNGEVRFTATLVP